jgi:putative nucleotidyltransferase with HDIG domain
MNREGILSRLREDLSLPALPEVLMRLDAMLRDSDVDLRKVSDLAATDAVLAGQIVRMANSAYYSRGGSSLTGLSPAIQRLGLRALRGLVYALAMPRLFKEEPSEFPSRELWRHSLTVAALSSEIASSLGLPQSLRDEAWLAGLVHDIGALALATIEPRGYVKLLRDAVAAAENGEEAEFTALERDTFGIDHAEAGGILLRERWRLPDPVPEVAERHHDLEFSPDLPEGVQRSTIHLVHVANGICRGFGVSWNPGGAEGKVFRESAWESLGLDLGKAEDLVARTQASLGFAETLLSGAA